MAIRGLTTAQKAAIQKVHPSTERIYLDFRNQITAPFNPSVNATFTLVDPDVENHPGSHYMTATSVPRYPFSFHDQTKFTISFRTKPTFGVAASHRHIFSTYVDATHYVVLMFNGTLKTWQFTLYDGTNFAYMIGTTTYSTDPQLQQWIELTATVDISGASPAGDIYIDGVPEGASWVGTMPGGMACAFEKMYFDSLSGTATAYLIGHVRLFKGYFASDAEVANYFKDVLAEEWWWPMDGHAVGRTRCNVTPTGLVREFSLLREAEKKRSGLACANTLDIELNNRNGVFSDDQYATYDPTLQQYNGTTSQRFLTRRSGVVAEVWYGGSGYEPFFVGRLNDQLYKRRTKLNTSRVKISAEDLVAEMAGAEVGEGQSASYANKKLADTTEADSLVHLIGRLASRAPVKNFVADNSFEGTIANSWGNQGAQQASPFIGTYCGRLTGTGVGLKSFVQLIMFDGIRRLSIGETFTFSVFLKAGAAVSHANDQVILYESDAGGANDSTVAQIVQAAGDVWRRYDVTHTITDPASDRIQLNVNLWTATTLDVDGASLVEGPDFPGVIVLNTNEGVSQTTYGEVEADNAGIGFYDRCGFDVDPINVTHGMAMVGNVWNALQDIADATAVYYMGMDGAGTFRLRSPFKTGYSDPTARYTFNATWEVASKIAEEQANWIKIYGVKIVTDTSTREIWAGRESDLAENAGYITLNWGDGDYWPDPSSHPNYWAKYMDISYIEETERHRSWWLGRTHTHTKLVRRVTNTKEIEILGASNQTISILPMYYVSIMNGGSFFPAPEDATQIVFDYTSRNDAARILFRNDHGSNMMIADCVIKGKLTRRFSGSQGFTHDHFKSYERIKEEGEVVMEIGNNMICTLALVNQLADYWWKDQRTRKHVYSFPQPGFMPWVEPGEWCAVQIGGAGQEEYLDNTSRVTRVEMTRAFNTIGTTRVEVREVEQNWTYDSGALARSLSSGVYRAGYIEGVPVCGASDYNGPCLVRCTGTNDETVIVQAMGVVNALGGGELRLSPGTFYLDGSIQIGHDDCILSGSGPNTVLVRQVGAAVPGITIGRASDDYVKGVAVRDLKVTRDASDTSAYPLIYAKWTKDLQIENVVTVDSYNYGIHVEASDSPILIGCHTQTPQHSGIVFQTCRLPQAINCSMSESNSSTTRWGMWLTGCTDFLVDGCKIWDFDGGFLISDCSRGAIRNSTFTVLDATYGGAGIYFDTTVDAEIQGNVITGGGGSGIQLYDSSDRVAIMNNRIYNCGAIYNVDSAGINVYDSDDAWIAHNVIVGHASGGINDGGTLGGTEGGAIRIYGTSQDAYVSRNTTVDIGNMLYNPELEADAEPKLRWDGAPSLTNMTAARDGTTPYEGTYSREYTLTTGGSVGELLLVDNTSTSDMHGLIVGQAYTFEAWVWCDSVGGIDPSEAQLELADYYSAAWQAATDDGTGESADGWFKLTVTKTINASATGTRLIFRVKSTASSGEKVKLDHIRFWPVGKKNYHQQMLNDQGTNTQVVA